MSEKRNSAARIRANNKYNAKAYDLVQGRALKSDRMLEMIEKAAQMTNTSKSSYVVNAVKNQLAADGITIDMLPPLEDASAAPPSGTE